MFQRRTWVWLERLYRNRDGAIRSSSFAPSGNSKVNPCLLPVSISALESACPALDVTGLNARDVRIASLRKTRCGLGSRRLPNFRRAKYGLLPLAQPDYDPRATYAPGLGTNHAPWFTTSLPHFVSF